MEEIEVKILNVDRKKCEKILLKIGAKKKFEGELITLAFDTKDKKLKLDNKIFRLRKEGDNQVLCLKEPISKEGFKRMNETEVSVSDFEKISEILKKIGFEIFAKTTKKRVSYKLDNTVFDFDKYTNEYEFIPEFLEIESNNVKSIEEYAKLLGYKKEDMLPWGFQDLLKNYKSK